MSSNPLTPSFRFPGAFPSGLVDPQVETAIQQNANSCVDLNQAIATLKGQISELQKAQSPSGAGTSTNTVETVLSTQFPGLGKVNDLTGLTSYTVQTADNGIVLEIDDASPVAISLNSTVTPPYFFFATNLGTGIATLTPTTGTINGGASYALAPNATAIVTFTGGSWVASGVAPGPDSIAKVAHEWLDSYDASTLQFTQSQPTAADVTNAFDLSSGSTTYAGALALSGGTTITNGVTADTLAFSAEDEGITFPNGSQVFEDATLGLLLLGSPKCTFVSSSGTTQTLENSDGVNTGNIVQISGVSSPVTPTILELYSGLSTSYFINTKSGLLDPSNTYEIQIGVGANSGTAPPTFAPSFAVGDATTILKAPVKALSTVTVPAADLITGGPSNTLTLAALTIGGTQGSITFVNGVITAFTPST